MFFHQFPKSLSFILDILRRTRSVKFIDLVFEETKLLQTDAQRRRANLVRYSSYYYHCHEW